MKNLALVIIKIYQYLGRIWGNPPFGFFYSQCRFYPSCSDYARIAIDKQGVFKGSIKTFVRLVRCNPWTCGGIDQP